jgi:hypothetical protein
MQTPAPVLGRRAVDALQRGHKPWDYTYSPPTRAAPGILSNCNSVPLVSQRQQSPCTHLQLCPVPGRAGAGRGLM